MRSRGGRSRRWQDDIARQGTRKPPGTENRFSLSVAYFPLISTVLLQLTNKPPRWPGGPALPSRTEDPGFESRLKRVIPVT